MPDEGSLGSPISSDQWEGISGPENHQGDTENSQSDPERSHSDPGSPRSDPGSPPELVADDGSEHEDDSKTSPTGLPLGDHSHGQGEMDIGGFCTSTHRNALLKRLLTEEPETVQIFGGTGSVQDGGGVSRLLIVPVEADSGEAEWPFKKGLFPYEPPVRHSQASEGGGQDRNFYVMPGSLFKAQPPSQADRDDSSGMSRYKCTVMPAIWVHYSPDSEEYVRDTLADIRQQVEGPKEFDELGVLGSLTKVPPDLHSYANQMREWLLPLLEAPGTAEMTFGTHLDLMEQDSQGTKLKSGMQSYPWLSSEGTVLMPN